MANIVREHIKFFSEQDGTVTSESIKKGHHSQCIFKGVSIKARAICSIMGDNPHNVATLEQTINPSSTGIWSADGTFDKNEFDKLVARSARYSAYGYKRIITKENFLEHLEERHGKKNTGLACYILKFIPVSWKRITNGSIDELFEYYGDVTLSSGDKAFTEERLYAFYTDPNKLMTEKSQHKKQSDDDDDKDSYQYCTIM
jgi:hypothetical protein